MGTDSANPLTAESQQQASATSEAPSRTLQVVPPFDLARTVAPAWWARGRWPNVDWREGRFRWVGWESGEFIWRSVRQIDGRTLEVSGSGRFQYDRSWAERVLGIAAEMPAFREEPLVHLAAEHAGMKPWSAGSLYEGAVSSIVGQSVSVASAAITERRLFEAFHAGLTLVDREFWPPPRPDQLAAATVARVRASGVTTKRAHALIEIGRLFANELPSAADDPRFDPVRVSASLLAVSGIGPWTVRSAFLWGLGDADAHPTGDVALLRAVRRRLPHVSTLKQLDFEAESWRPHRGWAARLFWLDLLGFDGPQEEVNRP